MNKTVELHDSTIVAIRRVSGDQIIAEVHIVRVEFTGTGRVPFSATSDGVHLLLRGSPTYVEHFPGGDDADRI
jgi:hypothetical protein